jgi:ferritin-like metal-binding protein YciE
MEPETLKSLYVEQLRDLYSAESQLCEALPKMMEAATHPELKRGFEKHLEVTKRQRDDISRIIQELGENPEGHECKAMQGLITEGEELIQEHQGGSNSSLLDAGLIAATQRIEHYEIAGYGTVRTYAEQLGERAAARVLNRIAQEEGKQDQQLTTLAVRVINPAAGGRRSSSRSTSGRSTSSGSGSSRSGSGRSSSASGSRSGSNSKTQSGSDTRGQTSARGGSSSRSSGAQGGSGSRGATSDRGGSSARGGSGTGSKSSGGSSSRGTSSGGGRQTAARSSSSRSTASNQKSGAGRAGGKAASSGSSRKRSSER